MEIVQVKARQPRNACFGVQTEPVPYDPGPQRDKDQSEDEQPWKGEIQEYPHVGVFETGEGLECNEDDDQDSGDECHQKTDDTHAVHEILINPGFILLHHDSFMNLKCKINC